MEQYEEDQQKTFLGFNSKIVITLFITNFTIIKNK
jgi:hypothetical protein